MPDLSRSGKYIWKDLGTHWVDKSLTFLEKSLKEISGTVIKIRAERGTPYKIYNTRLYTDSNEEIWLSGLDCGRSTSGALGLCEAIKMLNWHLYIPAKEIVRIVLTNAKFDMEYHPANQDKKIMIIGGFNHDSKNGSEFKADKENGEKGSSSVH